MSSVIFGQVITPPDGAGLAVVSVQDAARMVYCAPTRFASPFYVPITDDIIAVAPGTPFWTALFVVGRGTASYVYSG